VLNRKIMVDDFVVKFTSSFTKFNTNTKSNCTKKTSSIWSWPFQ
jgi:hypothetical protein